jgi:hypothetical protein
MKQKDGKRLGVWIDQAALENWQVFPGRKEGSLATKDWQTIQDT